MSGRRTTTSSPGDDVVDDVAVDRRPDLVGAALQVAQELQQAAGVVALREALALHQAALGEHGVGVQEPVGGDQVDLRVVGPAGEQRLQDAGERALADGDAAGDADHVRHPRRHRAEERRRHPGEVLRGADVQVEQARQRQVDRGDLVEVDALVDAAQLGEVVLAERQRGGRPQRRPVVATDREEPAPGLDHTADPTLGPCPRCNPPIARAQAARRLPDAALARRHRRRQQPIPDGVAGRRRQRARPGVRRRPLPRRRRPPRPRRRRAPGRSSASTSTPAPCSAAAPWPAGERTWRRSSTATPSPRRGPADRFDVVVGNPPYLSQLAAATTRGGASRHGGGPYADAAVEFLALAVRLARPDGGRIGLVLPQSILASRDAAPVRAEVDRAGRRSRGRGGRRGRCSTPRCSCARWSFERRRTDADGRPRAVDRRRHRRARRAAAAGAAADGHARRPGPADGELPRPVLRAGPGGRRGRRRARRS